MSYERCFKCQVSERQLFNGVLFKAVFGYLTSEVALRNQFYVLSPKPKICLEFVSMITFISSEDSLLCMYSDILWLFSPLHGEVLKLKARTFVNWFFRKSVGWFFFFFFSPLTFFGNPPLHTISSGLESVIHPFNAEFTRLGGSC